MLSRNATDSISDESPTCAIPSAAGTIRLPKATNSSSAAIVAQVVMTWLLAMRTALLLPRFTLVHLSGAERRTKK